MKKKILLIEDDQTMRENTAEILELAQYNVVTATNGRDGSIMAKEVKPDLIVSDIMMPGLDGYGVLHVLSKDPSTASIPFIFLTAKAEKSEWRKGMELGADDYITKPFEDTELLNAVEARLKKTEAIKKEFSRDIEGLNQFLEQAKGMKELDDLSLKRPASKYKKKEIIFHAGDRPHYLFFLNKGRVKTYKTHDDGKEYITSVYKEGDFFGHPSLFDDKAYPDSALVLEESEICKIPKEDFLSLMYRNRDVAGQFVKMLSNQIEEQEKQLLRLAYDTVRKRTAEALLKLHRQYSGEGKNSRISVTREDLAGMAGTATETAIRCLSEFKEDEFIVVHGREITIMNTKGLEGIQ
jgi:CRP-like cAMP-binding protein/CheY-like chemotaxis protein